MERETTEDYLAKLNIEGERKVWLENHPKIEYAFTESKRYLKPKMSACELGVGDGHLLRLLNRFGLKCTGIDISGYLVKQLGTIFEDENLEINLLQHDISEPINYVNTFDAVFCLDILEHVENLETAIDNIKKILKPGGILIATLPWKESLDNNAVICPKCHHKFHKVGHFHSFKSYDDVVRILGNNFQILRFDFIPPLDFQNLIIDLLKKTMLRHKYYKDGEPNFQNTILFIARVEKEPGRVV